MNESFWVHTAAGPAAQWIRDHANYAGDDCIAWPFTRDSHVGRGRIGRKGGGGFWAHRVMCEYVKGTPPTPKHQAAHSCGNGHLACMNPNHLSWKTGSQNALDRAKHGTNRKRLRRFKLTPEQVAEIKAAKGFVTQVELAARYGVSDNAIRNIHAGRTWKGDTPPIRLFTDAEVAEVRKLADYISLHDIAQMFNVSWHVVSRIVAGKTYRDKLAA